MLFSRIRRYGWKDTSERFSAPLYGQILLSKTTLRLRGTRLRAGINLIVIGVLLAGSAAAQDFPPQPPPVGYPRSPIRLRPVRRRLLPTLILIKTSTGCAISKHSGCRASRGRTQHALRLCRGKISPPRSQLCRRISARAGTGQRTAVTIPAHRRRIPDSRATRHHHHRYSEHLPLPDARQRQGAVGTVSASVAKASPGRAPNASAG